MLYDLIFVGLFVAGWSLCGFLPWLTLSVVTRGNAGLAYLPLCVFAGNVAGLAVPLFILDDRAGLWLSFLLALATPAGLLGVRRFSLGPASQRRTGHIAGGDVAPPGGRRE